MAGRFGISAVYSIVTLHTAEMFPTEIRNSALGTSSTMSHVGSIAAPYVVDFLVSRGFNGWNFLRERERIMKNEFGFFLFQIGINCMVYTDNDMWRADRTRWYIVPYTSGNSFKGPR